MYPFPGGYTPIPASQQNTKDSAKTPVKADLFVGSIRRSPCRANLLEASAIAHQRTAVPHANEVSVAKFVQIAPETNLGLDRFGFGYIVHIIESNDIVQETNVFQALQWTFNRSLEKKDVCVASRCYENPLILHLPGLPMALPFINGPFFAAGRRNWRFHKGCQHQPLGRSQ